MKNLNKFFVVLGFFLAIPSFYLFAQVSINTDNSAPANSAMLDVKSTTKGMLIPRMTSALRTAITTPVDGLMVYQTDGVTGVYCYTGTTWKRVGETDGSETKVSAGLNVTVTGTGTIASPYIINASDNHYVGQLYGGGIVLWVDNTGQHGLIVSLIDLSTYSVLSDVYDEIGPTAQSTWNGQANSTAIMGQSGFTTGAALLCDGYTNANYSTGIYSDWYLPAIDQLSMIYNARYILNKNIESVSGANLLGKEIYWSSTEDYGYYVFYFNFGSSSYTYIGDKATPLYVRAVRAF
jgi:hypothetical protein